MHVRDTLAPGARELDGIDAGPGRMSGIEQQADRRSRRAHQALDLRPGLDHGPYVVMIDERQAVGGDQLGEARQPRQETLPLLLVHHRAL